VVLSEGVLHQKVKSICVQHGWQGEPDQDGLTQASLILHSVPWAPSTLEARMFMAQAVAADW
jgi:hypothetical protein